MKILIQMFTPYIHRNLLTFFYRCKTCCFLSYLIWIILKTCFFHANFFLNFFFFLLVIHASGVIYFLQELDMFSLLWCFYVYYWWCLILWLLLCIFCSCVFFFVNEGVCSLFFPKTANYSLVLFLLHFSYLYWKTCFLLLTSLVYDSRHSALLAEIKEMSGEDQNDEEMVCSVGARYRQPIIPHMKFDYTDPEIQQDLYQLMKYSCEEVCTPEQRDRVMKIWTTFLEPFLGLPSHLSAVDVEPQVI